MRPHSKKMVFLVFPRQKMVLGRKTNVFLGKNGFGVKNQFFPRKKIGKENQLLQNQKQHFFWGNNTAKVHKDVLFGFSVGKKLVFLPKTIFFLGKSWLFCPKPFLPRKKLVFHAKTIVCPGKSWFSCPKPSFS